MCYGFWLVFACVQQAKMGVLGGVFRFFSTKVRSRLLRGSAGGVIFALVIQRKTWIQFLHD